MQRERNFRLDINGLRAFAVMTVILYHFSLPGFSGGFVGVDVFFVISGFLMSGIVFDALDRGHFSLIGFYAARARRIFPALIVLCAVLLVAGYWLLMPAELEALGGYVVYVLTFTSNLKFRTESGYFDVEAHEKWLLHTWSLSVEWQFYLLLPLALMLAWKVRPRRSFVLVATSALLVGSLGLSTLLTQIKPAWAFYMLPTRAWEMLAGSVVYLVQGQISLTKSRQQQTEILGLTLILCAAYIFTALSEWPGWLALLPVVGATCVLLAARPASPFTANRLAQWLGTRSYSLYLWHWPVVVGLGYMELSASIWAVLGGIALTMLLGDLSFRFVEIPTRRYLAPAQPLNAIGALVGVSLLAIVVAAYAQWNGGFPGRFGHDVLALLAEKANKNPRAAECLAAGGSSSPSCVHGGPLIGAVLLGDSHANAVVSALAAAMPDTTTGILELTYAGCPTMRAVRRIGQPEWLCDSFFEWTESTLDKLPPEIPIVVVNRHRLYLGDTEARNFGRPMRSTVLFTDVALHDGGAFQNEYLRRVTETACAMSKRHVVYLVRPIPEMAVDVPTSLARSLAWGAGRRDISSSLDDYRRQQALVWQAQDVAKERCGARILDPLPYFCSDGRCRGSIDGFPLYRDKDHLSEFGNRLLVPMFAPIFPSTRSTPQQFGPDAPVTPSHAQKGSMSTSRFGKTISNGTSKATDSKGEDAR
jgi:peptidoglycan/LPS O-acetylase OafA/YrhL